MRKFTLLFIGLFFILTANAADNWGLFSVGRSGVSIDGNIYTLYDNGPGTFNTSSGLGTFTVGSTVNLTDLYVWTWKNSGGDVTGGTYYYLIYPDGNRPSSPTFLPLNLSWITNDPNNAGNQKWGNAGPVNILNGLAAGTYRIEIYGQINGTGTPTGPLYDNVSAGNNHSATFTISPAVGVDKVTSSLKILNGAGKVSATFEGEADVQLYTSAGQLIRSAKVTNEFLQAVKTGVYVLRVNNTAYKVIVK